MSSTTSQAPRRARRQRLAPINPNPARVEALQVLVVDDSPDDRLRLGSLLRESRGGGVSVSECETGQSALELLRRERIDVVLVDSHLPDMSGMELVSHVADLVDDTAVILMSGEGNERMAADAIKHGARDYLPKRDLDAATLDETLTAALRTARLEWRNSRMTGQLQQAQEAMDRFVRQMSRNMGENIRVLEQSFQGLKDAGEGVAWRNLASHFSHVERGLRDSQMRLEQLIAMGSPHKKAPLSVELTKIIADCLDEQAELLREHGIEMFVEPSMPAVACHASRLKRVFTGLLKNAAKRHQAVPNRRIEISVAASPAGMAHDGYVWVRFHDNAPSEQKSVGHIAVIGGQRLPYPSLGEWGMDLAIAQRTIDHYHGTLLIDDDCQGMAFVFSLPAV